VLAGAKNQRFEQTLNRVMSVNLFGDSIHVINPLGNTFRLGLVFQVRKRSTRMELWKIHKYCESASLQELRERQRKLSELIENGEVQDTNAKRALEILTEYIELKSLFED